MAVRSRSRRHGARLAAAWLATTVGALTPACLPDIHFEQAAGDAGDDAYLPGDGPVSADGSLAADARSDVTVDAGDAPPGDAPGEAGPSDAPPVGDGPSGEGSPGEAGPPSTIGPFAADLWESYAESARCAVRSGALYCWGGVGSNQAGQLGLPPQTEDSGVSYPYPTAVPTVQAASLIAQIAMGAGHACTLYGRTAYCRGDDGYGQLGNATAQTGATEVAVQGLPAGGLDAIAAAAYSTCGITLLADAGLVSNVFCWGRNGEGQLGRSPAQEPAIAVPVIGEVDGGPLGAIPDAVAIAGGGSHHCALTSGHAILCWGGTDYFESGPLRGPAGSCPGGNEGTCLFQPQPVVLPTDNGNPEVPVGIALGDVHSCAVAQSGNVYCWGADGSNQLGIGTSTAPQTCTNLDQTTTSCSSAPMKVAGLTGIQLVRAGALETCALDQAHHAHCWGYNADGELGGGDTQDHPMPVLVSEQATGIPPTFDDLAVGSEGACGRSGDTLYCWGAGVLGTQSPEGGAPPPAFPAPVRWP